MRFKKLHLVMQKHDNRRRDENGRWQWHCWKVHDWKMTCSDSNHVPFVARMATHTFNRLLSVTEFFENTKILRFNFPRWKLLRCKLFWFWTLRCRPLRCKPLRCKPLGCKPLGCKLQTSRVQTSMVEISRVQTS